MSENENWKQITLITNSEKVEEISDLLVLLDALAITCQDAEDDPILEPLPGEVRMWPNTKVIALFDKGTNTDPIVSYLKQNYGDNFPIAAHDLEDKDWVRAWMDNFKPIECGKRLWICPSWHKVDKEDAVVVMLDPGLAFGTGTHPTTLMCLKALDSLDLSGKEVLDYGCGSGILAIAALKLGAAKAYGVDIDPQAIIASKDNAERNHVLDKLELFEGQDDKLKPCPVVVANILAGPLTELEPYIASLTAPHGMLILSGILYNQVDEIKQAYSQDYIIEEVRQLDEWACVIATRKA